MNLPPLVALAGLSGTGKDTAAEWLIHRGYVKHAFGCIIKRELDPLIRQYFGFSAFTEDRAQKAQIRRTLESWGEDSYQRILDEYMQTMPTRAVNTRLVRCIEARAFRGRGGVIIEVVRPGVAPATEWEVERMRELHAARLIDATITNAGTVADLHAELAATLMTLAK